MTDRAKLKSYAGRITVLRDSDGDGKSDTTETFAKGL